MTNDHRGECRSDSPLPLSLPLFIAFCRILPTNVVICRLQSIAKYSTLYFAFCKACARGIPLDPFHEVRTYTQPTVKCASCGAFPHWLSPPPPGAVQTLWNKLSVGADFLPRQRKLSMVATPLFCKQKSKPLTACF